VTLPVTILIFIQLAVQENWHQRIKGNLYRNVRNIYCNERLTNSHTTNLCLPARTGNRILVFKQVIVFEQSWVRIFTLATSATHSFLIRKSGHLERPLVRADLSSRGGEFPPFVTQLSCCSFGGAAKKLI
jgi:hypothetical protein